MQYCGSAIFHQRPNSAHNYHEGLSLENYVLELKEQHVHLLFSTT